MLAVIAIFALVAALVAPNLDFVGRRALRNDAERLAAQLELARQRAVVTAVPHRLLLDLEDGGWQLQWQGRPELEEPPAPLDLRGGVPIPLEAPREEVVDFIPVPGALGRYTELDPDVLLAGVDTPEGWVERGEAYVVFSDDGTSAYTRILLSHDSGQELELEVQPLAERVRILDAED